MLEEREEWRVEGRDTVGDGEKGNGGRGNWSKGGREGRREIRREGGKIRGKIN